MKETHNRIGLLSLDGSEIEAYAHERHKIGECPWCDFIRVENITKDFIRRLDITGADRLYMWSLGTSLKDTRINRKLLMRRWRDFTKRMWHCEEWNPVFRVVEVGRRGFLHIHCVTTSFTEHAIVLRTWRSLTKEKSNVHVSGYKGVLDPRRLARYLMKYLTKESSKYHWLGSFRSLGARSRSVRNGKTPNLSSLQYGGLCYGGMITEGYDGKREQQSINTF